MQGSPIKLFARNHTFSLNEQAVVFDHSIKMGDNNSLSLILA
jgi:hypothetical protein